MRQVVGFLFAVACAAQQPAFDAASVKMIDVMQRDPIRHGGGPGTTDPGRIHYSKLPMTAVLSQAYNVDIDRVSGPAWMRDFMGPNLYIIDATMPANTTKEQLRSMLQNLMAERFHLVIHHETRDFPGYDLTIAKDGPKLKESKASAAFPDIPRGSGPAIGTARIQFQGRPFSTLVRALATAIPQALGGAGLEDYSMPRARVTDKTGLTGTYDFTLEYACEGCRGMSAAMANLPIFAGRAPADPPPASEPMGSGLPTIFAAIEKQLGLKLEKTPSVPLDVIVVDRVDKVPTAN
jgi:uncharacterized protein (TIGR03435 family)